MRMKYWKNEIKHICNETIQPPETNGTIFLLGAKFARGQDVPESYLLLKQMAQFFY